MFNVSSIYLLNQEFLLNRVISNFFLGVINRVDTGLNEMLTFDELEQVL